MIDNTVVQEAYNKLLNNHSVEEANYILLNSLAILGDKKVFVQSTQVLDEKTYNRINRYKYPERLASFINITNEKSTSWANLSFVKLALL